MSKQVFERLQKTEKHTISRSGKESAIWFNEKFHNGEEWKMD